MAVQLPQNAFAENLNRMLGQKAAEIISQPIQRFPEQSLIGDMLVGLGGEAAGQLQQYGQQKTTTQALMEMGIEPEVAEGIAALPPDQQKIALNYALGQKEMQMKSGMQQQQFNQMTGAQPGMQGQYTPEEAAYIQQAGGKGAFDVQKQRDKQAYQQRQEVKPIIDEAIKDYKVANERLRTIKRMKELDEEGVMDPASAKFKEQMGRLPYIGGLITGTIDEGSQEFVKLQQEFLRDLRSVFGGRITNTELTQFMKGVPTLMNTKKGRERIYKNLELMYKGKRLQLEEIDKIRKENGGQYPEDLNVQLAMRVGNKIDKISDKIQLGNEYTEKINGEMYLNASKVPNGRMIVNNQTGERMIARNGKWVKA